MLAALLMVSLVASASAASLGIWSEPVTARTAAAPGSGPIELDAPEVQVETLDSSRVRVSWNPVVGATAYLVERNGGQVAEVTQTSYVDNGLEPATDYAYRVRAYAEAGEAPADPPQPSDPVAEPPAPDDPGITDPTPAPLYPEGPWDGEQAEAAGFPGPNTTGALERCEELPLDTRTALSTPGETIEGVRFEKGLTVWVSDVTLRNVCINANESYSGIRVMTKHHIRPDAENLTVEDVTITGMDDRCQQAVGFANYTARRLNVSGCYDGFRIGNNTTVEDSYIHDLNVTATSHNDAIQSTGDKDRPTKNLRVRNNTMFSVWQGHQVLLLQAKFGPIDDVEISGNLLQGGGYTVYIEGVSGMTGPTNVRVTDNLFVADSWRWRPWLIRTTTTGLPQPDVSMSGNRDTIGNDLDV